METSIRDYIEFVGIIVSLLLAFVTLLKSSSDRRKTKIDIQAQYDEMLNSALEREKVLKGQITALENKIDEQSKLIETLTEENTTKDKKIKALQNAMAALQPKRPKRQ